MNNKVNIATGEISKSIIAQIRRLALAIQVEKQCSKTVAIEEVSYFLKQLIFIIGEDIKKINTKKNNNSDPLDKPK